MLTKAPIWTLLAMFSAAIMLAAAPVFANETEITVGVYHFPPIASVDDNGEPTGLLGDLLQELEQANPTVSFRVFHTSPKRRYLDFEAGLYDVIFFDDLEQRSIVAISGYHYGFTGYETDNSVLEQKFNIEFSDSHSRNIKLIKADRPSVAEVAIVSHSYLQRHLTRHPEDWDELLVSKKPDQRYQLSIIARKGGTASADEMLRLLAPLVDNGRYRHLVENWGLQLPAGFLTGFEAP